MKKILFTIQWYPSVLSANALCDQKIINELQKDDFWDITCLTYKGPSQQEKDNINGVKIFRFNRSIWWNLCVKARQKDCSCSRFVLLVDKFILRLKQFLFIPIYPYLHIKTCFKFVCRAISLHRKEHFDIVISEHNGMDSLFAGYFLKWYDPNIKFVAILWDPISAKEPAKYLPKQFAIQRLIAQEKLVLNKADYVIGMKSSEATVSKLISINPDKHLFYDIPNITKPHLSKNLRAGILKTGYINIVFSGILSLPDRDPELLIKTLNLTSYASKLNLVFFCSGDGKFKLNSLQKEFNGCMLNLNYIPYDEILSVYANSDVLLNFGGRNPNMVPSKIFDYMSFGKPIISVYSIDNEASKTYLDRYPLALCLDDRKSQSLLIEELELFFSKKVGQSVPFEQIENLYKLNTPYIYSELIKRISNK